MRIFPTCDFSKKGTARIELYYHIFTCRICWNVVSKQLYFSSRFQKLIHWVGVELSVVLKENSYTISRLWLSRKYAAELANFEGCFALKWI
jgi:hypothetical protein